MLQDHLQDLAWILRFLNRSIDNHGMTIMRERAEAFGGNFDVTSVPGQGTKIEVQVPIDLDDESRAEKG